MADLFKISNKDDLHQNNDDDLSIAEKEQDLSKEIMEKKQKGLLKTGLTTGTSASAATKSALLSLLTNISTTKCSNNPSKRKSGYHENFMD